MSTAASMSKLITRREGIRPLRRQFGRASAAAIAMPVPAAVTAADDMKLFVSSFVGGLVFMMVYLA